MGQLHRYSGVFLVLDKTEGSVKPIFTQVIDKKEPFC